MFVAKLIETLSILLEPLVNLISFMLSTMNNICDRSLWWEKRFTYYILLPIISDFPLQISLMKHF
jgi:hypothetical protein